MGVSVQGGPNLLFKIACCSLPDLERKSTQVCEVHQEYLHVFIAILDFRDLSSDIVTSYYSCNCGFMINEFSTVSLY